MTREDAIATDSACAVTQMSPLMPPIQALTARFEMGEETQGTQHHNKQAATLSRATAGESRQGFRIGELRLMIRYEDSSALSEMSSLHRLPNAPGWFNGMANLHGKLTPVFDLAGYLGVDHAPESRRMLLVLSHGADATGILIDGLPERLRLSADERTDVGVAPERLLPHLRGASHLGERLWLDLDTQSLLGAIEQSLGGAQ